MKIRNLLLVAIIAATTVNLIACKKKKNDNPLGSQRIALLDLSHDGAIYHYHMVYDQYNNVDSIVYIGDGLVSGTNGFSAFSYFGSSYSVTDESNSSFTVYTNSSGQVLQVQRPDTLFMKYANNQLGAIDEKIITTTPPYYHINTTGFYWTNGDVTFIVNGNDTVKLDYDLTKSGQPADPLRISNFLSYGSTLIRTIHLVQDMKMNGNMTEQYFYQFNGSGRISQFKKVVFTPGVPPTSDTFTYDYSYY